jgi:hypothetical protein
VAQSKEQANEFRSLIRSLTEVQKVSDCNELAYTCAQFISTTLVLPDPSIDQYLVVAKVMTVQ